MSATTTVPELAVTRAQAAADLETAIAALGIAHAAYQRVTQQLSDRMART